MFSRALPRYNPTTCSQLLAKSFLKQNTRTFHASTANMTIQTYASIIPLPSAVSVADCDSFFDVTWEGPVLDTSGRPTATVKSKYHLLHHFLEFND
jgi:peptidylprolyl isomerase